MRTKILFLMLVSLIGVSIGVRPNLIHAGGNNTTFLPLIARPTPPISAYRAVISAFADIHTDLYTVRADESELQELTDSNAQEANVSLSPDNQWVLFAQNIGTEDEPHGQVRVVRSNGTEERLLADLRGELTPEWSPDGRYIAIQQSPHRYGNTTAIYLSGVDVLTPTLLVTTDDVAHFRWSPDSHYIAYSEQIGPSTRLYTISIPEGSVRQVASDINYLFNWSPTGTYLAFGAQCDEQWDIALVHPDGQEYRYLTDTPENESVASWVNHGQQLLLLRASDDFQQLWLLSPEDGSETEFTEPKEALVVLGVSPDGSKVLWIYDGGIWLQSITSTTATMVERQSTPQIMSRSEVQWSDDLSYAAWGETYLVAPSLTETYVVAADFTVNPPVIRTAGRGGEGSWLPHSHTFYWGQFDAGRSINLLWDLEADTQTPIRLGDRFDSFGVIKWWLDDSPQ